MTQTTVNWNGKPLPIAQAQPVAGHPDLGLRPKCTELQRWDDANGAHLVILSHAGAREVAVYPAGINQTAAIAYAMADGFCVTGGVEIGPIPAAEDIPAEVREVGYQANNVPQEARLPTVVAQAPQSAAVAAAPAQGGGINPVLILAAMLLFAGAAAVIFIKPAAKSQPKQKPETAENNSEQPPAAEPPKPAAKPAPEPTDFEKAHADLQDLLRGVNQ